VEDKIFEFTEKMYSDLKKEIQNVGNQVTNFETNTKYSALFDAVNKLMKRFRSMIEGLIVLKISLMLYLPK